MKSLRLSRMCECSVVAIAASTGGPNALEIVLTALPAGLPAPILIVQPPLFTALLARRLNDVSQIAVVEAEEGQILEPGHAYLAPGGKHLDACTRGTRKVTHLREGLHENSCRPAADLLFRAVAEVWGGHSLEVIMAGMGQDGTRCTFHPRTGWRRYCAGSPVECRVGNAGSVVGAGLADGVYA